MTIHSRRIASR